MKTIALLCDVLFLVWIIFMLVVYPPKWSIILFSFGLCFLLILNIIAITIQANGEDFFALYFRKKNLEQKLRIRELEKKIDRNIR